jgi:hypothetical protein
MGDRWAEGAPGELVVARKSRAETWLVGAGGGWPEILQRTIRRAGRPGGRIDRRCNVYNVGDTALQCLPPSFKVPSVLPLHVSH